jgi:hypothetical protein
MYKLSRGSPPDPIPQIFNGTMPVGRMPFFPKFDLADIANS